MQLAAEDEEWLAIDDELRGGAALFKVRCGGLLGWYEGRLKAEDEQKNWQRAERDSHNEGESSTLGEGA